jgi:hypothetical protein
MFLKFIKIYALIIVDATKINHQLRITFAQRKLTFGYFL